MTNVNSKIEWTETWNIVTGCTKVSDGCDHCYAERLTERFHGKGSFAEVKLNPDRLDAPLRWRKPRRVFVNSMSDLFHKDVPDGFIARVFAVMAATPQHTYQILTKRHGRMRALLSDQEGDFRFAVGQWRYRNGETDTTVPEPEDPSWGWPLPNVWLGCSVENQKHADLRIPALLKTPAVVRFLSCEPLIGSVDLDDVDGLSTLSPDWMGGPGGGTGAPHPLIDWVIAGGESGPNARPMHPLWPMFLQEQCESAGVSFFFKQWGEWLPVAPDEWRQRRESDWLIRNDGYTWPLREPHGAEDGTEVTVRRVGKKSAGRERLREAPLALAAEDSVKP